ncbi:MAG: type II secretion system F family protein [Streptosporangiaceae bacterium]
MSMPLWLALLLGTGFGLGVWLIISGAWPARPPLARMLAALYPPPAPRRIITGDDGGWAARAGQPAAGLLRALGLPTAGVRRDLAVLGRGTDRHLAEKAAAAVTGLLIVPLLTAVFLVAGMSVPVAVPVWAGLALATAGFFAPDLAVRAEAAARRADARHALSAFLDLATIALAGGAGIDQALGDAATDGDGWAFRQIRRALAASQAARTPPWDALAQLGMEIGVSDLGELAASVQLAGTEGARVRASLTAKAEALRTRQMSEAEAAAASATERMSLPVVVLFAGFLLFLAFPAVAHVLTGL